MVRERDADKRRRRRTCPTTLRHVPRARDRETELPHRLENVTKKQPDRFSGLRPFLLLNEEGQKFIGKIYRLTDRRWLLSLVLTIVRHWKVHD